MKISANIYSITIFLLLFIIYICFLQILFLLKMEISDCMWDEDFLCVDTLGDLEPSLGSTSLPSPNLAPFQWSLAPLADEADNSDMTPQCMPVIDPKFVRDHFIEDCVLGKVRD